MVMNVEPQPEEYRWQVGTRSVSLRDEHNGFTAVIGEASIGFPIERDVLRLWRVEGSPESVASTVLEYARQLVELDGKLAALLEERDSLRRAIYETHSSKTASERAS